MACGSLPRSLHDGTSATNGQGFAGLNVGTINYANSNDPSFSNATLDALPNARDAPFNAFQRQHDPTCLPDTRVDLREIRDWADGGDSLSIFWLSGLAGTGKSTIAIHSLDNSCNG